MSRVKLVVLNFLILNITFPVFSQIPVGQWRDHFPYVNGISVADPGDEVFCATDQALFSFRKSDFTLTKISKIQGLSDIHISKVRYSQVNKLLFVAYLNGNIDLLEEQTITNLSDIIRANIPGSKKINNILFSGNIAYLSCDFGIIVLDLLKKEFKDTYYIGEGGASIKIFDLEIQNSILYAATENGIKTADITDPLLIDFSHWNIFPGTSNKIYTAITSTGDDLFVNQRRESFTEDSVFRISGTSLSYFTSSGGKNNSLVYENKRLILTGNNVIKVFDDNFIQIAQIGSYGYGSMDPREALIDNDGKMWVADHSFGLMKITNFDTFDAIAPNGPNYKDAFNLTFADQTLWVAGGGLTPNWGNTWKNGEWFFFRDNEWTSHLDYTVKDILLILPDPENPDIQYASTWGYGILQIKENSILQKFDQNNSSLQADILAPSSVKASGLMFDQNRNLWVVNSNVNNPVSVMKPDGVWKNYRFGGVISGQILGLIRETQYGDKWLSIPRKSALFVFNDNGTIEDESDDHYRKIALTDDEGKSFNYISSFNIDIDGNIWIGTDRGVLVIYNPEDALYGGNIQAQRIKIPRNDGSGLADYLLSTEVITAITIDGANRKWFGTHDAGVFLFSSDGITEIESFNTENSPLPSKWVHSIAIDPKQGEVFFATTEGILSFRGTATSGVDKMTGVYVFPNPVRPEYSGPITITGLISNAYIKITDINGDLVFQSRSLGGQAIWDGKTLNKGRAHSGVYLVFISNEDGTKTFITKILFIH